MEPNISRSSDTYVDTNRANNIGLVENQSDRDSWKSMTNRFYTDITHLMEKEGQLIRAELNEKVTDVKAGVISLVSAGVVMFVGLISLAATATILLDQVTSLWLASVIVTAAFLIIGAIMLGTAKKKLEADKLKPRKSIEAFGEIRHSLKEKVNEITKH